MPQEPAFISVIIPTYARPGRLRQCLTALGAQTWPRDAFEVIVVDDGSPQALDDVVDAFRPGLNIALARQENSGPGAARNRGAGIARGTLLAFTDDDCLPEEGWLEALADAHRRAPSDLLGGHTLNPDEQNLFAATSQLIVDSAYRFYNDNPSKSRFFASNNMAVPAALFQSLGGFAVDFRVASEDRELCDRCRWKGHGLRYAPEARVQHARELSLGSFISQHFNYGRGAFQFHRVRSYRRSGSLAPELRSHGSFLREVVKGVSRQKPGRAITIAGLLGLWQVSNAIGYLYATVTGLFSGQRRNETLS